VIDDDAWATEKNRTQQKASCFGWMMLSRGLLVVWREE
jgi:hypothetical protein